MSSCVVKSIPQSVTEKRGQESIKALYKSLYDELLLCRCVVLCVVKSACVQEVSSVRISEFDSLLDDPTHSDVTFVVNNECTHVHMNILTAPTVFLVMLLYLYTDELTLDDSVKLLVDVLRKAKEVELTRLVNGRD